MSKELKCPKCGSHNIDAVDCFDTKYGPDDIFIELYCGYCEDCDHEFEWKRIFIFKGYEID